MYKPEPPDLRKQLTPKQVHVFDALHGKPFITLAAYGRTQGIKYPQVHRSYRRACEILGVTPTERKRQPPEQPKRAPRVPVSPALVPQEPVLPARELNIREVKASPAKMLDAVLALSDPELESLAAAAKSAGIKGASLKRLLNQLETAPRPIIRELREVRTDHLARMAGTAAEEIISRVDVADIEAANLKDKILAYAILVDKKLLLEGKPTQRVAIDDIPLLDSLVKAFLKDVPNRGMEITIEDGQVSVERREVFTGHGKTRAPTQEALDAEWDKV